MSAHKKWIEWDELVEKSIKLEKKLIPIGAEYFRADVAFVFI